MQKSVDTLFIYVGFFGYAQEILHELEKRERAVALFADRPSTDTAPEAMIRVAPGMVRAKADGPRERLMAGLQARGIESRPYFHPVSAMGIYAAAPTPVTARKSRIGINLPTYFELTRDQVRHIAAAVNEELRAVLSSG